MKSIKVKDFMAAAVITLHPDQKVLDAIHTLVTNRISGAPVVDDTGDLVGVLSERDCLQLTLHTGYHGEESGLVRDYMATQVESVDPTTNIVDIAHLFMTKPYRRYPVVRNNRVVGVISRRDVLRCLLAQR
ncbi:MAG: CBS domain-containing protein [Xanthomonadales bacterium]|nr:CBS domain-containing protein [Xanthomonadales bacterium]